MKARVGEYVVKNGGVNRRQKRRMLKQFGLPMSMIGVFDKSADVVIDQLIDGTIVTLDYDRIMEHKEDKAELYLKFVEEWKDKEVHVYQDTEHAGSQLYCLEEDTSEIPWLFDMSELKIVEIPGGIEIGENETSEEN